MMSKRAVSRSQNPQSYLGVGGLLRPLKVRPITCKHVLEFGLKLRRTSSLHGPANHERKRSNLLFPCSIWIKPILRGRFETGNVVASLRHESYDLGNAAADHDGTASRTLEDESLSQRVQEVVCKVIKRKGKQTTFSG
jgi:hypothetical protein